MDSEHWIASGNANMQITGGCRCGKIRFKAMVDPTRVIACHCLDCQIFSGAPYRPTIPAPIETVEMTGESKRYTKTAESGRQRVQAFCGDCGTQLFACDPDHVISLNLRVGCIDQRSQLRPTIRTWARSAMPWTYDITTVDWHQENMFSPLMTPDPDRGDGC